MTAQHKNARRNRYWSAALHRIEDAEALVIMAQGRRERRRGDKRRWAGARYIAGIAVECMIKYAICIWHDLTYVDEKFPELITSRGHDLAYGMEKLGLHRAVVYSEVAHDWEKVFTSFSSLLRKLLRFAHQRLRLMVASLWKHAAESTRGLPKQSSKEGREK